MSYDMYVQIHGDIESPDVLRELMELMAANRSRAGGLLDWLETAGMEEVVAKIREDAAFGYSICAYGVEYTYLDDVMEFCERNSLRYKFARSEEAMEDYRHAEYWRPGMEKRFCAFEVNAEPVIPVEEIISAQQKDELEEFIDQFR